MNYQWMRVYLAVLESGSMAGAARQQHLTQPAVSMIISSLEDEIGQTLLERFPGQRRQIRPTAAGELFRDFSQNALSEYDKLKIRMLQDQSFASFIIGTSPTPASILMPVLAGSFKADFPKVPFVIRAHSGNELVYRLKQREFDIAITGIPIRDPDIIAERFFYDPMELACPASMNLEESITINRLRKLPLIIRNQNCNTMQMIIEALAGVGLTLNDMNIATQVYGNSDVLQAVSLGSGVGFVTRSLINAMPAYYDKVNAVTVKRLNLDRHLSLLRLRRTPFSSGPKIFWDYALSDRWQKNHFSYNTKPR